MAIFNDLMQFFNIGTLSEYATFLDLINYIVSLSVAVFIVAFIIKGIFFVCTLPNNTLF